MFIVMKENVTQYNSGSEEQSNILLLDFVFSLY